jgi:hypothetical protein
MTIKIEALKGGVDITDQSCIFSTIDENKTTGGEGTFVFYSEDHSYWFPNDENVGLHVHGKQNAEYNITKYEEETPNLPTINFISDDEDWDNSFADSLDVLEMMANKAQTNLDKGLSKEVDWSKL